MYNIHNSPKKQPKSYHQSPSFIRDLSPNRFRNTIRPGNFSQPPPISRLRQSFSASSLKFFDQFSSPSLQPKQEKKKTYESLKNTLNELENRIWHVNSQLIEHNFTKKKKQQNLHEENQQKLEQIRQTVSTETTNLYSSQQKISKFKTSQPKPANFHPVVSNQYDSKKFNSYYISQAIRAINQKNSLAVEHINASIKMIQSCLEYVNESFSPKSKVGFEMKRLPRDLNKKKVLVLDLDQTLIHCYENLDISTDITLSMSIQGQKVKVGFNIRPYAMTFLKKMSKMFEIVIFTASHQTYANAILDELDPENQIFSHRFYRPHCVVLPNDLHVKDLRYLKRDLKDVILVDNAAYSYSFQLDNGIPILPFYQGKDFELGVLENYLEKLVDVDDVRVLNREYFKLDKYKDFQSAEELIKKLYCSHSQ